MHRVLALLLTSVALIVAVPGAQGSSNGSHTATVHAACTYHRIAGERKCIAAGQFCQHSARANRDYHRYGYHCGKQDRNGRYHLVYR